MKHFTLSIISLWLGIFNHLLYEQPNRDTATMLIRFYEDNDFINLYLKGTDNAYTNGSRIDLFFRKKNKPRLFIDRLMPKAGDGSVDIYGWGIAQIMFTPNNIAATNYQPDDYPYSGALFATHSLYSYSPEKKYDLQTELVLGVSGPASFTRQTQSFVHRLINYQEPMGWSHQAKNKFILNINFAAEKQLAFYNGFVELLGGVKVYSGTMYNAVSMYTEIRVGSMSPYFNGFISQYSQPKHKGSKNKIKAYLFAKPQPLVVLSDAL